MREAPPLIILHATFLSGSMFVWGESAQARPGPHARAKGPPRPARRSRRSQRSPVRLPFDAGARVICDSLPIDGRAEGGATRTLVAWLPTVRGTPIPSSEMIAPRPQASGPATLQPWSVEAVELPVAQAIELIPECASPEALAPGVIAGDDLRFWVQALRLAAALAARQRFLPDLIERRGGAAGGAVARWRAVIGGGDAQSLRTLAASMPGAARALRPAGAGEAPTDDPGAVLRDFVDHAVDAIVRGAVPGAGPPPPRTSRRRPKPRSGESGFASTHDQFVHALRAADASLDASDGEVAGLVRQISQWRRPVELLAGSPFRLCFRLEEPDADGPWTVRYLLQANDDPSLMLPATDAWGKGAPIFRRHRFDAREYLLLALGQTARLSPDIESSLRDAAPQGYELDVGGAHEFLVQTAGLLEEVVRRAPARAS